MLRNVKILGRTAEDGEGTLWMGSSACEISFDLKEARFLSFVLTGDGISRDSAPAAVNIRPRFAVYLDGEKVLDQRMDAAEKEICVFSGEKQADHTLRLVKLSECSQSIFGVKEIRTDGRMRPLPEKKLKMEFIGDSITCGYGVEGKATDTFSTATENAEKAYAFLAARELEADAVMTAISGCGLLSGYTEGEINEDNLMQPYYEKAGRNDWILPGGKRMQDYPWDFSSFRPDWVVINLGNNDLSWTRGMKEREKEFGRLYQAFLTTVRRNNPRARILCVLGMLGEEKVRLTDTMMEAVEAWRRETGDERVCAMPLPEMDEAHNGAGSDHHPSEKTQRRTAEMVAEKIRELSK